MAGRLSAPGEAVLYLPCLALTRTARGGLPRSVRLESLFISRWIGRVCLPIHRSCEGAVCAPERQVGNTYLWGMAGRLSTPGEAVTLMPCLVLQPADDERTARGCPPGYALKKVSRY